MNKYYLLLTLILSYNITSAAEYNDDPGLSYFKQGQFEYAVQHWAETLPNISANKNPKKYIDISLRLAMAYHALGRLKDALQVLKSAKKINYDNISHANVLMQLSDVYLAMRNLKDCNMKKKKFIKQAKNYLHQAHRLAKCNNNSQHPLLCANILNRQANILLLANILNRYISQYKKQLNFQKAGGKYCESAKLADSNAGALSIFCPNNEKSTKKSLDKLLSAKIFINILNAAAQYRFEMYNKLITDEKIPALLQYLKELPPSHDKSFAFISIAKIMLNKSLETEKYIHDALENAITVAKINNNNKAIAYAKFYLAQLYAKAQRYKEAIQLTRQAIFHAQKNPIPYTELQIELWGYPDLLFSLEWQLGKFLTKAKKPYQEIDYTYDRANKHLELVHQTYASLSQKFRDDIEKFYFNWADLLLQQAQEMPKYEKPKILKKAIETIELFKKAEIRNYFENDCITEKLQDTIENLYKLPKNVAVFYPLLFDDRIELLTINRGNIQQKTVSKTPNLKALINQFSEQLAKKDNDNDWKTNAQTLYNLLIKPIILDKQIDTLIIVPNSVFRNIPFTALHDGKNFLIEKYALVISPGIKLTIPTKAMQLNDHVQALLSGSKEFQQDRELEHVPQELNNIAKILGIKIDDIILNEEFTLKIVKNMLKFSPYSILHFATHGQFKHDLSQTFLRTYDGKITMDDLEDLININKQIELLTLSACETAVGNDRAALGLAGIAIKTGVPSVLATLWKVDDLSTRDVIVEFYRQLKENKFSKTKALQEAQKKYLKKYKHPYYWAPFVLIGNYS